MDFSETGNTEENLQMNPHAAETGKSNGITSNGSTKQAREVLYLKRGRSPYGLWNYVNKRTAAAVAFVSIICNLILILVIIALSVRRCEELQDALPPPITLVERCPDGWIGYQSKCYYFSDSGRNWTYSQNHCASVNASLVVIESQEEMSFLRRYKGPADYWIGLQRTNDQEPWKWINGTIFRNTFKIRGGGNCAYISDQGIASSSSTSEELWICSKPVGR